MNSEFTALIEQRGDWYVARCLEIPGVAGQGPSPTEAGESLAEAIALHLGELDEGEGRRDRTVH